MQEKHIAWEEAHLEWSFEISRLDSVFERRGIVGQKQKGGDV